MHSRFETLEQRVVLSAEPIELVFAPGTPREYVEAVELAIDDAQEYTLAGRWSTTATNGGGLAQGDVTTLTWSIVDDGTPIPALGGISGESSDPSNLVAYLGNIYGVQTNDLVYTDELWFPLFQSVFDRWEELTGIDFVYTAADDGAGFSAASSSAPGVLGTRADIRIGGHAIDGNSGVLAYNFYPNNGEMVIDTNDNFYGSTGNNSIRLRNVLAHEVGHGIGISHSESGSSNFLMEPFINTSFDGPQFDDILAAQRHYGDASEGNDSSGTATRLGTLDLGDLVSLGGDATDMAVSSADTAFLSIDDDADEDFFSFTLPADSNVRLTLTPVGPTYTVGGQGQTQSPFDAAQQSDLTLQLLDADGITPLATADAAGLGDAEIIEMRVSPTGTYYARIAGTTNTAQMYQLDIEVADQDFGDAPSAESSALPGSYPVTRTDNGARHGSGGPTLGGIKDLDFDGAPSLSADGDDLADTDDEDGITFSGPIVVSPSAPGVASVDVELSNAASSNLLDGWIDWNRDGDWDDTGEQIFTSFDLGASDGTQTLNFTVPQDTGDNVRDVGTVRYAWTGFAEDEGANPWGLSGDGSLTTPTDGTPFSIELWVDEDAQDIYEGNTNNLAGFYPSTVRFTIFGQSAATSNVVLGFSDDVFGNDRLSFVGNVTVAGITQRISAVAHIPSSSYSLFNNMRADPPPLFATSNPTQFGGSGVTEHDTFTIPADAPVTSDVIETFARFRLSTTGGLSPTGAAVDGEVEDHPVTLVGLKPPVLTLPSPAVTYTEDEPPVLLDPAATISDPDSPDFDTGTLTLEIISGGSASDRLSIRDEGNGSGQVGVAGSDVTFGGVTIGSYSGGVGIDPLVISFNASSSPAAAQAVLRNVTFENVSQDPSTTARVINAIVTDGDGGVSPDATQTVSVVALPDYDFGDAPTAAQVGGTTFVSDYPVTLADDGARHFRTGTGPTLGTNVDAEFDGVHSAGADADDTAGSPDDEDGISFAGPITVSRLSAGTGSVDVNLQSAGPANLLDGWIDFNRDGDWDDAGEQIFSSFDLGTTNGIQSLNFTVPQDVGTNVAAGGTVTYSWTGFLEDSGANPWDLSGDGSSQTGDDGTPLAIEVVVDADAPDLFGPIVNAAEFAPSSITIEIGGVEAAVANPLLRMYDDDQLGFDRIDFYVDVTYLDVTQRMALIVVLPGGSYDLFDDSSPDLPPLFTATKPALYSESGFSGHDTFAIPAVAPVQAVLSAGNSVDTYSRFRISSGGGLSPRGSASDGEVEDHQVSIVDDTITADLSVTTHGSEAGPTGVVYTVTLSEPNNTGSAITFQFFDLGTGTATADVDFVDISSTAQISVADGASAGTFVVTVTDDGVGEPIETINAQIFNPSDPSVLIGKASATALIYDDDTFDAELSVTADGNEAGSVGIEYTVTLDRPNNTGVPITFDLTDLGTGTATSGVDYAAITAGTQISIADGSAIGSIVIPLVFDGISEPTETVIAQISNPSDGDVTIVADTATASILDDDTFDASLSVTSHGDEAGPIDVVFTVTLSGTNNTGAPITFEFDDLGTGTASINTDYQAVSSAAQITVADGSDNGSTTVLVANDDLLESTETIVAQISSPSHSGVTIVSDTATADLVDNDTATANLTVTTEGDETGPQNIVFTITLDKQNDTGAPITFEFDDLGSGTATSGADYIAIAADAQITVPAGADVGTLTVTVSQDLALEATETIDVQISGPSDSSVTIGTASATATIADNDAASVILQAWAAGNETGPAPVTFRVVMDRQNQTGVPITFDLNDLLTGTASSGTDYTAFSGAQISIAPGNASGLLDVPVIDDALAEGTETVTAQISAPSDPRVSISTSTVTADILDNDTYDASLSVTADGSETGPVGMVFTVSLDRINDSGSPISFDFDRVPGSAVPGFDFVPIPADAQITVAEGASSGTFTVAVIDDAELEATETLEVQISNPSNPAARIVTSSATASITDNETAVADFAVTAHGGEAQVLDLIEFRVTLSRANLTGSPITFDWDDLFTGTATSGLDYEAIPGSALVSIADGSSTGTVPVRVIDDLLLESTETLTTQISNPSNPAVTIGTAIATADILDDETTLANLSVATHGSEAGPVDIVYEVTLGRANNTATAINFDIDDLGSGTATSGTDYAAIASDAVISVPVGASSGTFTVTVLNDSEAEPTETVAVSIANPSNAAVGIGTSTATADIVDDEIEIRGIKWQDTDGDGERDAGEPALPGWTIFLDHNNNGLLDIGGQVDPDDYTAGTVLNTIIPEVTLSAVGPDISSSNVTAVAGGFANNGNAVWLDVTRRLRMDFAQGVSNVSIDYISDDASDIGRLQVFDAAGNILGEYITGDLSTGVSEMMSISRSAADIAYAIAGGFDGQAGRLDNLSFGSVEPFTVTDSSGEYVFTDLQLGTYRVREVLQEGWTQTSPVAPPAPPTTVVVSEINVYSPDWIEIQNVSGGTVDTSGWQVVVSESPYRDIHTVNPVTWNLPATMAAGEVQYRTDSSSDNYWGSNLFWNSSSTASGWAMILDEVGEVVDWIGWGWNDSELASFNVTVGAFTINNLASFWSGPAPGSLDTSGAGAGSLQRIGSSDNDSASDWIWGANVTKGGQNPGLNPPLGSARSVTDADNSGGGTESDGSSSSDFSDREQSYTLTEVVVSVVGSDPLGQLGEIVDLPTYELTQLISLDDSRELFSVGGNTLAEIALEIDVDPLEAVEALAAISFVQWAEPNYIVEDFDPRDLVPTDPDYNQQYHHPLMQNDLAWDITLGDPSVIIGVTDDGVDIGHVDLVDNIWVNPGEIAGNLVDDDGNGYVDDVNGWDFIDNDNDPSPVGANDHGTHVSGIAAGRTNNATGIAGTAGGATILPLKFFGSGSGNSWTSTVIAETYQYAIDNGAKIVNTSYNVNGWVGNSTYTAGLQYYYDNGGLHLNSAGNATQLNPARQAFEQSLFVASTTSSDSLSGFSNYGTGVDVAAPGSAIYSTLLNDGYGTKSGTSMSTPNAAGVAALIWSANPTWTRDQVAAQLVGVVDNIDAQNPGFEGLLGRGRVNSHRALTETLAPPRIDRLVGVPTDGGSTSASLLGLAVQVANIFDPATVNNLANWELVGDGADDIFGTADDVNVTLAINSPYMIGTNEIRFDFGGGVLGVDSYRFTAKAAGLADPFGTALDGLGSGQAGNDFTHTFSVVASQSNAAHLVTITSAGIIDGIDFGNAPPMDYGDAPTAVQAGGGTFVSDYAVTFAEDGARHAVTGPTLGMQRDADSDGLHSAVADGDDTTASPDDEDGVTFAGAIVASAASAGTGTVDVELRGADGTSNRLDAWIDFNRDGDWDDAGEQIFVSEDLGRTDGIQSLTFGIPLDSGSNVEVGMTYARFRLSTAGGLSPTGAAADGEVEDVQVEIVESTQTQVTIEDVTVVEGNAFLFTVLLSEGRPAPFDVNVSLVDGTAIGGTDYDNTSVVLSFAGTAGETQQFSVTTTDDAVLEGPESFTVNIDATDASVIDTDTAIGTITDNDSASVTIDDVTATEGNGLMYTVTLSDAVQGAFDVNVTFTDGTATGGTDYDNTAVTLNFAGTAGETQQFTVPTTDDVILESPETLTVYLAATNAFVTDSDTGTGTITDNDAAAVTVDDVSVVEGDTLVFTVSLDNAVSDAFEVAVSFTDGTATGGTDYDNTAVTLNFAGNADETQQFTVTTTDDALLEGTETFIVNLDATNPLVVDTDTATGTLTEDDETFIGVDGSGILLVQDINGGVSNDSLRVSLDGTNIRVVAFSTTIAIGNNATLVNDSTVDVPIAAITGNKILIDTLAGDDELVIPLTAAPLPIPIEFAAGTNSGPLEDRLRLTGNASFASADFSFVNAHDGSISIAGNLDLTFTGVEPIFSLANIANVSLNFSEVAETITVARDVDDHTLITSTQGQWLRLRDPGGSLEVHAGDTGDDTVVVESLVPGSPASLLIDGGSGVDTVQINGALSFAGSDVAITADTIDIAGTIGTAGGDVTLSASGDILIGARIDTGGGVFAADADSDGNDSGVLAIAGLQGPGFAEQQTVTASDAAESDFFGSASISGGTAIVGAYGNDDGGNLSGAAYIFVWDGAAWIEQQKLLASDDTAGHLFGQDVAISGDTAVVGAYGDAGNRGAVYVFTRTAGVWSEQAKLTADDGAASDFFGVSVSIDGDTVVVGSEFDDDDGSESGSAYVFTRSGSTWSQQAKLTAGDAATGDKFGSAVAVDGDTAVIGAPYESGAGAAYVFTRSGTTWTQQAKLTGSTTSADDLFGDAVAIDGDTAIIGGRGNDDTVSGGGSAYVFTRSGTTWAEQAKLNAADTESGDGLGYAVSISGDTAVVTTTGEDSYGANAGAAYVFQRTGTTWTEESRLRSPGTTLFGEWASIDGDRLIVGGRYTNNRTGAAHLFEYLQQNAGGSVAAGNGAISITAHAVDLQGPISGTGTLLLAPSVSASTIGIGGAAGSFQLDDAELNSLVDGFSSITIGDPASGTGVVDLDSAVLLDPVTLAGGTIHDASSGIDITAPSVTLDATVAPGQSPGVLSVAGDAVIASGETFDVEIGGTTPGTANADHDQLSATGAVDIQAGAVLSLTAFNGFVPSGGDTFTIIQRGGGSGTFAGLPEGAVIPDFLGRAGVDATISYASGDGDDVVIEVAGLVVEIGAGSISEGAGATATVVTITRTADTGNALTVNLSSSDTTEATVPVSVIIPAGQSSATVDLSAIDDAIVDGTQTVTVTATASGYESGSDSIDVTDDDVPTLTVTIDQPSFSENGGTSTATVTRNTGTSGDLIVSLAVDDGSEATVPPSVLIPGGSDSATFTISGVDDAMVDGTQTVTITASDTSGYSLIQTTDLGGLGLAAIGGLTFDDSDGRLWVSDGGLDTVFEVDPLSGAVISSFDVSVAIAGLTGGPDGVAVQPGTGDLYFFEGFGSQQAGVTTQAGAAVRSLLGVDRASGAAFNDAGELFVFSVNDFSFQQLDPNTGAVLSTQRIVGSSPLLGAIDFDPVSGNVFAFNPSPMDLLEIDVATGTVLGTTDLSAFFGLGNPRGMAFNTTGDRLFISDDDDQIVVLGNNSLTFLPGSDTVDVTDDDLAGLTLAIDAAAISENGGTTTATVTRNTDTTAALEVTLASSDAGEAIVPASVTIAAGQATSPAFTISGVDDVMVDGTQTVTIMASAAGHDDGLDSLDVTDDDAAAITLTIADEAISEKDGTTTATVSRNTDATNDLVVTLVSSDTSEATVPESVIIPAGQSTSAAFIIAGVDDAIADGTQTVTITATATAHGGAAGTVDVTDDEVAQLTLVIDAASISEKGGVTTATVSRNSDTTNALTVNLTSSDTSEAIVPASITIAAGQTTSAPLTISAVDDALVDGTQTVTVTATAVAHADAADNLDVTDAEELTLTIADSWVSQVVDSVGDVGAWSSLAIGSDNLPRIAYEDRDTSRNLKYAAFDGSSWAIETVHDEPTDDVGQGAFLALDWANRPHIGYQNFSRTDVLYAHYDGTSWLLENANPNSYLWISVAVDSQNDPLISSWNHNTSDLNLARRDGTWTVEAPDPATGSQGKYTSVAVDAADNPWISYVSGSGDDELRIAHHDGTAWQFQTIESGSRYQDTSVTIDSAGNPHVAYYDFTLSDLKYAAFDGTSWTITTVDTFAGGKHNTLVLDSNDHPHIAYGAGAVRYASFDGSDWSIEFVAPQSDYPSLALDQNDSPVISYYDRVNDDLMLATLLDPVISENGGSTTATVTRTDTAGDLTVNLVSNDTTEATVVASVVIPDGQATSPAFAIDGVDDLVVDGTQTVTFIASAAGYDDGSDTLDVTDDDVPELTLTIDAASIDENAGTTTATVTRNTDTAAAIVVTLTSSDTGEASVPATVTIPAAQASATFTITGVDDTILDGTQSVTVTATADAHADAADSVQVTDNDTATASLSVNTDGSEQGPVNVVFMVTLDKTNQTGSTISFDFDDLMTGTATSGDDYSIVAANAKIVVGNGASTGTVTVPVVNDLLVEGVETLIAQISGSSNPAVSVATASATANITDNDNATITIEDVSTPEGGRLLFRVTLAGAVAEPFDVNVSFTDGTAIGGTDFNNTPQSLSFTGTDGESHSFVVLTTEDAVVEPSETLTVNLDATNVLVDDSDTAVGTILDDDGAAVTVADVSAAEGGGLLFTVTLDNAVSGAFDVAVSFSDGTATGGIDYDNTAVTLNFAGTAGETQQFTVSTTDDALLEGPETFTVNLDATNALVGDSDTATGTITDNDGASVTVADVSAAEGGRLLFTVTLDNAVSGAFDVNVSFSDGTATGGIDYDNTAVTLNFAGTAGETQQFTVSTTDDAVLEGPETFTVNLDATNALVGDSDTATGTITDNDGASVTVADVSAAEGGGLLFTVTLDNAVSGAFDVNVSFSDGTATGGTDYDNTAVTLNFAGNAGETQQFTVTTTDDAVSENTETFTVDLSASNALVDDSDTATGSILDNDASGASEVEVIVDGLDVPDLGAVTFSDAALGGPATSRTFTVSNSGTSDLILQPIILPAGFVLASPNFTAGQIVAPAAQVSFTVELQPSTVGQVAGQLSFATNDADEANYRIDLSGVVIDPSDTPTDVGNGRVGIDNGDNGFLAVGGWNAVPGYGFESDALAVVHPDGDRRAIWAFDGLAPGQFEVAITWLTGSDRAEAVPVVIRDGVGGPILSALTINQRTVPSGPYVINRPFEILDTVTITGDTLVVELSNQGASKAVIADAVLIESIVPPPDTPEITLRSESGALVEDEGAYNFAAVQVGDASSQTFTVRNDGTADLVLQPITVTGSVYSLSSANFTFGQTLGPGAQVTFSIDVDTSAAGTFNGKLVFDNNDADEGPFNVNLSATIRPPGAIEFFVDDGDPDFATTGGWLNVAGYGFAADAKVIAPNKSGTATWTFGSLNAGEYNLSTTWLNGSDRATSVSHVVRDGVGGPILATVPVNQKLPPSGEVIGGRAFASLGSVILTGDTLVVEVSNQGTDGAVIADAVRLVAEIQLPDSPEIKVTQGTLTVLDDGSFSLGSAEQGDPLLTRTFTVANTGTADLTLEPITVTGAGFSLESANFASGQILAPGATTTFTIGRSTASLGTFEGGLSFANNDADENPFDVALMAIINEAQPEGVEIIDNGDTGFSATGTWADVSGYGFAGDALAGTGINGVETAQWVFDGLDAGATFEVSTTWLRGSDREATVTYVIRDGVGGAVLATIVVDQRQNPGGAVYGGRPFQVLDNVTISGTTLVVELSTAGTSKAVIADAVRIAQQ